MGQLQKDKINRLYFRKVTYGQDAIELYKPKKSKPI